MWLSSSKTMMPAPEEALPGRSQRLPVPEVHFVNGARLEPPFPEGTELALFGMGCFWGAERKFWQTRAWSRPRRATRALHAQPDLPRVCSGRTGHNEVVRVVFDPRVVSYAELLRVFWENHDPTQGMRQGNDAGTQYRSGVYAYGDAQQRAAEASRDAYQQALRARVTANHHRDRAGARVLLRRGRPPAIPGQEPGAATAASRHRRGLPGGPGHDRLTRSRSWRSRRCLRSTPQR